MKKTSIEWLIIENGKICRLQHEGRIDDVQASRRKLKRKLGGK